MIDTSSCGLLIDASDWPRETLEIVPQTISQPLQVKVDGQASHKPPGIAPKAFVVGEFWNSGVVAAVINTPQKFWNSSGETALAKRVIGRSILDVGDVSFGHVLMTKSAQVTRAAGKRYRIENFY
jgi:hypothetical protein